MFTLLVSFPNERDKLLDFVGRSPVTYERLRFVIENYLRTNDFLLYSNGKELGENHVFKCGDRICVSFALPGGKGGFGSMLRAIGAQIEKTTNREACRDLSGRRLRDINEEQRLKKWIAKKAEREAEKEQRRKARIERLKHQPKHNFVDFEYEKEISQLPERIDDALTAGIQKVTKRPLESSEKASSSKKKKLWLGEDVSGSSTSDSDSEGINAELQKKLSEKADEMNDEYSPSTSQIIVSENCETSTSSESHSNSDSNIGVTSGTLSGSPICDDDNIDQEKLESKKREVPETNTDNVVVDATETSVGCSANHKVAAEETTIQQDESVPDNKDDSAPIDLLKISDVSELEALGLERLKTALIDRGLKCGGNLKDRAHRLWTIRNLEPSQYPKNLLAKQKK